MFRITMRKDNGMIRYTRRVDQINAGNAVHRMKFLAAIDAKPIKTADDMSYTEIYSSDPESEIAVPVMDMFVVIRTINDRIIGIIDDAHICDMITKEREMCLDWLSHNLFPSRRLKVYHNANSYALKHRLQDRVNIYVTNNQFKELMLTLGYYPSNPMECSWEFFITKASPIVTLFPDRQYGIPMLGYPFGYTNVDI